jgi:HlyD family secretion protein
MRRFRNILIPLLALGLLIGLRLGEKRSENLTQQKQREARLKAPPVVTVAAATSRVIAQVFQGTGSAQAPLSVNISPKVTGRIEFLQVHEGDPVKKGQVLVRIDKSQVEAQVREAKSALVEAQYRLAQAQTTQLPTDVSVNTQIQQQKAAVITADAGIALAQANLADATAKYNRIFTLYKQGYAAAQDVDDAKAAMKVQEASVDAARAQLNQAKASLAFAMSNLAQKPAYVQNLKALKAVVVEAQNAVKAAQATLADTVLVSSVDGFVTGRFADPGTTVTPGQTILAVQYMRQVWVSVAVPEEVSPSIHEGQLASVKFDALPGRTFPAGVIQFNPSADPQSRQFTARVALDNKDNLFKPGMYGRISIVTQQVRSRAAVPREAIQTDQRGEYALVVGPGNKAERRVVVPGLSDADFTDVQGYLRPGERVIVLSANPVRPGQVVRVGRVRTEAPRPGAQPWTY